VNNECATAADGQLCLENNVSEIAVHFCVFSDADSTYAMNDSAADTIRYCDAYGNVRNAFAKAGQGTPVFSDTLHVDPKYNATGTAATGYYRARDERCYGAFGYMGWERWSGPLMEANYYTTENVRHDSHFRRRGH
jgi:hypothetical protein